LVLEGITAHEIFSTLDDMKLRSSMTLFAEISVPGSIFEEVIEKYFAGEICQYTVEFLMRLNPY
jgi:uncharacterized protein (DUF1810 family)